MTRRSGFWTCSGEARFHALTAQGENRGRAGDEAGDLRPLTDLQEDIAKLRAEVAQLRAELLQQTRWE